MSVQRRRSKPKTKKGKGRVRNATPMKVDGIQFKSKLEVYCYEKLREAGIEFEYEKDKYVLSEPFAFTNDSWELGKVKGQSTFKQASPNIRAITYTPDFTGDYKGQRFLIETKGLIQDSFLLRWKLCKRYIQANGLNINLYMPRNRKQIDKTINLIKSKNESN